MSITQFYRYYCKNPEFIKRQLVILLLLAMCLPTYAQLHKGPVVHFSFNNKSEFDNVSGIKAKLSEAVFAEDRFGNPDHAVFLHGNEFSYINLGKDSLLKPETGSISLWFNISRKVWSGTGYTVNPIIITKYTNSSDFFESYGLVYVLPNDAIALNCAMDSTRQLVIVTSSKHIYPLEWHHAVITMDDHFLALYLDGQLQRKQIKNYRTPYLSTDSVILGVTANKKNNRFLEGYLDDISFYDRVLTGEEVKELYHAPNPNRNRWILNKILVVNAILLSVLILVFFIKSLITKAQKKEKERLELANKLLETELRVNRALMNPHFVYNSLYSIQSLILNREIEQANTYLVKFSRLIRKTLESNLSDTISLQSEIDLLTQFIEIENLKFNGEIRSSIKNNGFSSPESVQIPVLMIQPFVENAIWHGLKNKEGEKSISITFTATHQKFLECTIEDNGIGRNTRTNPITENKSLATSFIKARLSLLNKIYQLNCELKIVDKPEHSGTLVIIQIPVFTKEDQTFLKSYTG